MIPGTDHLVSSGTEVFEVLQARLIDHLSVTPLQDVTLDNK